MIYAAFYVKVLYWYGIWNPEEEKPLSVNIEKHDPNYCQKKMKTSTKGMYKIRWHVHARETRNSLRMGMLWCEKARFVICTDKQNRNQLRCNPYAWDKNT